MTFPDSAKKAPNIFFDTIDGTGGPSTVGSVKTSGIQVLNPVPSKLPGRPTNVVAVLISYPPGPPLYIISQEWI